MALQEHNKMWIEYLIYIAISECKQIYYRYLYKLSTQLSWRHDIKFVQHLTKKNPT